MNELFCKKCETYKESKDFYFNKTKNKFERCCKPCHNRLTMVNYHKNREKILERRKTPECRKKDNDAKQRKYHSDPEYRKKILDWHKEYYQTPRSKAYVRQRKKEYLSVPSNRIIHRMSNRIRAVLRGETKTSRAKDFLGIEVDEFMKYLESKFPEGMTWENRRNWHIDHIVPCSYFDMSIEENQKICFYYKNLQPMWGKDNISKGNKILIENLDEFLAEIKRDLGIEQ